MSRSRSREHAMKKTWTSPQVVEKPVSLEVTMYLPAKA